MKSISGLNISSLNELDIWALEAVVGLNTSYITITGWVRHLNGIDQSVPLKGGMSHSNGEFTFPSTGVWFVWADVVVRNEAGRGNFYNEIISTSNDFSSEDRIAAPLVSIDFIASVNHFQSAHVSTTVKVNDVADDKVKFRSNVGSETGTGSLYGTTSGIHTHVGFWKVSD